MAANSAGRSRPGTRTEREIAPVYVNVDVRDGSRTLPYSIDDYQDSIYSQNGEDGILRELFLRLGFHEPFLVEFGVGDD